MILSCSDISCGVSQFSGLHPKPKVNLKYMVNQITNANRRCAFIIWSDRYGWKNNGNKLYHYIAKIFPSTNIQKTEATNNPQYPNSPHRICVYTWEIPKELESLRKWYAAITNPAVVKRKKKVCK